MMSVDWFDLWQASEQPWGVLLTHSLVLPSQQQAILYANSASNATYDDPVITRPW